MMVAEFALVEDCCAVIKADVTVAAIKGKE